jgi:hypothetical protein
MSFREGAKPPLFILLPSPAGKAPLFSTMVLAGEGFILKIHPEGQGVRQNTANHFRTIP